MSKRNDIVTGVEYTVLLKNALGPDGISSAQNVFLHLFLFCNFRAPVDQLILMQNRTVLYRS